MEELEDINKEVIEKNVEILGAIVQLFVYFPKPQCCLLLAFVWFCLCIFCHLAIGS